MSTDAVIFENETKLSMFPPKWNKKKVPLSCVSDIDI